MMPAAEWIALDFHKENISGTMLVALGRCHELNFFCSASDLSIFCLPAKKTKVNSVIQASDWTERAAS